MKYMQKKGEQFPIPFDEALYDAEIYEVFEVNGPAEAAAKSKPKKVKAEVPATPIEVEVDDPTDDDFGFAVD